MSKISMEKLKEVAPGIYKQMKLEEEISKACNVDEVAKTAWDLGEALVKIKDERDRTKTLGIIMVGLVLMVEDKVKELESYKETNE